MKKSIILMLLMVPCILFAQKPSKKGTIQLKNELDSVSYALGLSLGNSLKQNNLSNVNTDLLVTGIRQMISQDAKPLFDESAANDIIRAYLTKTFAAENAAYLKESKKFLEENSKKEGVVTLPSGLQYMVLKEGTGEKPLETDYVTTHYTGMTTDGKVFDSSVERGEPVTFPLNGVIRGWTEALQLMKVGSKWRIFIPPDMAYGENPPPNSGIKPNQVLIFDVELISVQKNETPAEEEQSPNQ